MPHFELLGARLQPPLNRAPFHEWIFPDGTLWTRFFRSGPDYLLRFPDLADFEISADGFSIRCWPVPGVTDGTIEHLYLNQALPLALSRQHKLVFHASAVEVDSSALAFMGESGRGKSTLAASFITQGFRFLTDDGLQLEETTDGYYVLPSHPSIRLWIDSREALVNESVSLAPPVQYTSKARILADNALAFCDEPRPLSRVYFLGDGTASAPAFERLSAREALIELVRHSFLLDIEEREMLTFHFDQLARLVRLPLYYRLNYPRRYDALPAVREAILRHASEESGASDSAR